MLRQCKKFTGSHEGALVFPASAAIGFAFQLSFRKVLPVGNAIYCYLKHGITDGFLLVNKCKSIHDTLKAMSFFPDWDSLGIDGVVCCISLRHGHFSNGSLPKSLVIFKKQVAISRTCVPYFYQDRSITNERAIGRVELILMSLSTI